MIYEEDELEVIDPLKALITNQRVTERMREQKLLLITQAREEGYSYSKIAEALHQTEAAVRLYVRRHQ